MRALLDGAAAGTRTEIGAGYVIVIAASAGGLAAISQVIKALPGDMRGAGKVRE